MSQDYQDEMERLRLSREAREQSIQQSRSPIDNQQNALPPIDEEGGFFDTAGDVAVGVASGISKGVGDIWGVADFLTFDALPDYNIDFGKRKTVWGNMAEGVSHFATAFIPVAGWIGRGGKVVGGAKTMGAFSTRAEKLHKINKARQAGLTGKAAIAAGAKGGVNKVQVGRDMFAGAIADNIIYNEDDQNLSSLLTQFPALEGSVFELLAVEEGDSELEARLKITMEGAGLGLLIDGVRYGIQRVRAGRKITEANPEASPEEIARRVDDEVGPPPEVTPAAARAVDEKQTELFPDALDPVDEMDRTVGPGALEAEPKVILDHLQVQREVEVRDAYQLDDVSNPRAKHPREDGINKQKYSKDYLEEQRVSRNAINLDRVDSPESIRTFQRATESVLRENGAFKHAEGPRYTQEVMESEIRAKVKHIADTAGTDPEVIHAKLMQGIPEGVGLVEQLAQVTGRTATLRSLLGSIGTTIDEFAIKAAKDGLDEADLVKAARIMDINMNVVRDLSDLKTLWGQGLKSQGHKASSELMSVPLSTLSGGDRAALIEAAGGRAGIEKALAQISMVAGKGDPLAVSKAATDLLRPTWFQTFTEVHQELFINSLIGGIKTIMLSGSGAVNVYWKGVQRMFGASLDAADAFIMKSEKFADGAHGLDQVRKARSAARQEVFEAAKYIQEITFGARHHFVESMKYAGKSWKESNSQLVSGSSMKDAGTSGASGASVDNIRKLAGNPEWLKPDTKLGKVVMDGGILNLLLGGLKLPSRAMVSFDEAVKQFQARSTASAKLSSEYNSEFARLSEIGKEADLGTMPEYISKRLSRIIRDGQIVSKKTIYREMLDKAPKGLNGKGKEAWAAKESHRYAKKMEGKNGALVKFIKDDAIDTTFQTPIRKGSIADSAETLLGVRSKNALHRMGGYMIAPFRKTPVNIITTSMRHLDLMAAKKWINTSKNPEGLAAAMQGLKEGNNKFLRQMASGDPLQRTEALGRLATGFTLVTTAVGMAQEGKITGRGPADRHERDLKMATGWRPYSFVTPNGYLSYQKMDPWATLLGMAADFQDVATYSDDSPEEQESVEFYFTQMFIAMRSNVADKAYLKGISNVMEAFYSEGGEEVGTLLRSTVAAHIPNMMGSAVRETNEDMKLVRTLGDAIRERIPGLSGDLPPRRNILGEPMKADASLGSDQGGFFDYIMPIAYHENTGDAILTEMSNLGYPFSPPARSPDGQGLDWNTVRRGNKTAYDFWTERTGTLRIDGVTMKQRLKRIIKSPGYLALSPESNHLAESPRIKVLKSVLSLYRRRAKVETIKSFPALMELSLETKQAKMRQSLGIQ